MATYAYTFTSGDTLTPTKLNNARTVSDIVNADIKSDAAIALSKLATGALPTAITVATANILDGNVTLAKLVAAVQQALVPTGTMIMSAYNTSIPSGWLWCDGSEKAIATYGSLYDVLGTTYGALTNGSGGAGSTHFRLPDMRGRFPRGWDGGVLSGGFGQYQADALQNITGSILNLWGTSVSGAGAFARTTGAVSSQSGTGGNGTNSITFDASNSTAEGGARTASETRVKNLALLFLIKT